MNLRHRYISDLRVIKEAASVLRSCPVVGCLYYLKIRLDDDLRSQARLCDLSLLPKQFGQSEMVSQTN